MKKYTQEELKEVLRKHKLWVEGKDGGGRANLTDAYLKRANLADAYLADANLARANLADANLEGTNLEGANLADAYLTRANLANANMECANLADAYLEDANLEGVIIKNCIGNGKEIKSIHCGTYNIAYTKDVLAIGCEQHSIEKWKNFTDDDILKMDGERALNWWKEWKDCLFDIIERSFKEV